MTTEEIVAAMRPFGASLATAERADGPSAADKTWMDQLRELAETSEQVWEVWEAAWGCRRWCTLQERHGAHLRPPQADVPPPKP